MLRKFSYILAGLGMVSVMFLSGCGNAVQLSLQFTPDESISYHSSAEKIKDFRFEQPSQDKLKEEQTKTKVEMDFTQTIQSVDTDGTATAQVTINELAVHLVNTNEVKFAFDSRDEKAAGEPLVKLVGQSYTIKISPDGHVSLLDASKAIGLVKSSYDQTLLNFILGPDAVMERHQVPALPQDKRMLSANDSWSKVVPSPRELLAPKSFKKTYTLSRVEGDIATVQMQGQESAEPVQSGSAELASGMGIFANMFDSKDDIEGMLRMNIITGEVLTSSESLITTYVAEEMPQNGDPDKGPDVLTMRFTNRILLEKLN